MSLLSRVRLLTTFGQGVSRGLPDPTGDEDPIEFFQAWWSAAEDAGLFMPEACALATASREGRPSARMVLLKMLDERGFVFFTNYESRKAEELTENPHAALCFHWAVLERQVRVEGPVERVSEEESRSYFESRGRGSRLGAWASRQSRPLPERAVLERAVGETRERFEGGEVPLPPFWGGFRVRPVRIEFWQGRADRLHDRLVFERVEGGPWTHHRLYP